VPQNLALNIGISGDRTEHLLFRILPKAQGGLGQLDAPELAPEFFVLMVGINNSYAPETPVDDSVFEGVLAVMRSLHARKPGARIVLQSILPTSEPSSSRKAGSPALRRRLAPERGWLPRMARPARAGPGVRAGIRALTSCGSAEPASARLNLCLGKTRQVPHLGSMHSYRSLHMTTEPDRKPETRKSYSGAGIGVGIAVGAALGAAFDQLALGIALGTALGAAIDVVSHAKHRNRRQE
jgi:hypothetical protein